MKCLNDWTDGLSDAQVLILQLVLSLGTGFIAAIVAFVLSES